MAAEEVSALKRIENNKVTKKTTKTHLCGRTSFWSHLKTEAALFLTAATIFFKLEIIKTIK